MTPSHANLTQTRQRTATSAASEWTEKSTPGSAKDADQLALDHRTAKSDEAASRQKKTDKGGDKAREARREKRRIMQAAVECERTGMSAASHATRTATSELSSNFQASRSSDLHGSASTRVVSDLFQELELEVLTDLIEDVAERRWLKKELREKRKIEQRIEKLRQEIREEQEQRLERDARWMQQREAAEVEQRSWLHTCTSQPSRESSDDECYLHAAVDSVHGQSEEQEQADGAAEWQDDGGDDGYDGAHESDSVPHDHHSLGPDDSHDSHDPYDDGYENGHDEGQYDAGYDHGYDDGYDDCGHDHDGCSDGGYSDGGCSDGGYGSDC